jgi:hypothetical protein
MLVGSRPLDSETQPKITYILAQGFLDTRDGLIEKM